MVIKSQKGKERTPTFTQSQSKGTMEGPKTHPMGYHWLRNDHGMVNRRMLIRIPKLFQSVHIHVNVTKKVRINAFFTKFVCSQNGDHL
jgi:hypothetical protein